jgi:hypothetical protein
MNFYKLSRLLKEAGYDSQVIPGGTTVASQPMQHPNQPQPAQVQQAQTQDSNQMAQAQPQPQTQAKDVNHLLQKVSTKLGNNVNKYHHLVTYLKNKPEMLDLFSQALEEVGGMQASTYQGLS